MRKSLSGIIVALFMTGTALILNGCSTEQEKLPPVTHQVEISGMQFRPAEIHVQKGDTVVFLNKDILDHDVTEEKSKAWTSSPLSPGQSYQLIVTGSADYYCSLHPVMKGKILVKEE